MKLAIVTDWSIAIIVVTAAYLGSFAATFGILMPLQRSVLPEFANFASLLFLPHGVRVLTAWLYGWRAIPLLTPGALTSHAYLYGTTGFSGSFFLAVLFGIAGAVVSFWLFARLGMDFRYNPSRSQPAAWREILLVGSFASVLNAAGTGFFFGHDLRSASAYFIGDTAGLIVAMLVLMLAFRVLRRGR